MSHFGDGKTFPSMGHNDVGVGDPIYRKQSIGNGSSYIIMGTRELLVGQIKEREMRSRATRFTIVDSVI